MAKKHLIIPDVQFKAGVPSSHLTWAGKYIAEKRPDTVVCIGDFADMPSLSQYDKGKKSFEGRRYKTDISAAHKGMELLMEPIAKQRGYKPNLILTLGNHEDRISRAAEDDPKLDGTIGLEDLKYEDFGWKVFPYLEPVVVDGVAYCHFFTSGVMGRPVTTAAALLTKRHMSAVQGHVQGKQIAIATRADGKQMTAIFAGGYYQHKEDYLRSQGNNRQWHGLWMLHEVNDGSFEEMPVTLNYLKSRYNGK